MARDKATITIDRAKADRVRSLIGARSLSDTIDVALDRILREERLRSDVAAYRASPQAAGEVALSSIGETGEVDDDVDWEALYAE